ncbi:hypothetical protein [Kitasatospora sp. NPDC058046]
MNTDSEDVITIVARTDPTEQEGLELIDLPDHVRTTVCALPMAAPA